MNKVKELNKRSNLFAERMKSEGIERDSFEWVMRNMLFIYSVQNEIGMDISPEIKDMGGRSKRFWRKMWKLLNK